MNNLFTPTGMIPILNKRESTPKIQLRDAGVPASTTDKGVVKGGSYENRIVYADKPEAALTVSAVYRAIELRSKTLGLMPVQYRQKDNIKGNFTPWMQGLGKRMNYLLQVEPNPIMTAASLWEQVTINRLQLGNGFVYIERDSFGDARHLWLAICGGYNMANSTYSLAYLSENGVRMVPECPRQNVLHFPNTYRYMDGFWGMPTLVYAAETLSLIKTEKAQALETAGKGGRVKLLIGEEQRGTQGLLSGGLYDKGEMQAYAKELQEQMYSGHDILAIRGLDKVQPISMSSAEMQMIEQVGMSLDDCARYYATPRPLLMLDTNSHYNDYQNATMEYHTRTILPDKTDMEKEIFRKLIGLRYYDLRDIHICEKPLLAMDPERQAKVDQLNLQTGAKTVNEIRQDHDMPAVDNGNIVYVSTNLAELGSDKLRQNGSGAPANPTNEDTP